MSSGDERFRALFEHAPVGVALCEPDGTFTDINATFRELLAGTGIDPDRGRLADLVRHQPDGSDEARAWREGLAAVRDGSRPVARVELSVAPPDAPPRWVQATAARVVLGDHGYLLTHLEDTTRRRLEQQRLLRLALHDGLTGLANRTLLAQRLDDALARAVHTGLSVGVLYLDLDGFKAVNDSLGHAAGDAVLVAFARRLTGVLRAGDLAGRLGGDEFLVVAADVLDGAALAEVVRRVNRALGLPLRIDGGEVAVTASVGAVLSRPGDTGTGLIRRADAAMYADKRGRRQRRVPAPLDDGQLAILHEQAIVAAGPAVIALPRSIAAAEPPAVRG